MILMIFIYIYLFFLIPSSITTYNDLKKKFHNDFAEQKERKINNIKFFFKKNSIGSFLYKLYYTICIYVRISSIFELLNA